jgi:hypothetical protein
MRANSSLRQATNAIHDVRLLSFYAQTLLPLSFGAACRKTQLVNEVQFEEKPYTTVVRMKKEV